MVATALSIAALFAALVLPFVAATFALYYLQRRLVPNPRTFRKVVLFALFMVFQLIPVALLSFFVLLLAARVWPLGAGRLVVLLAVLYWVGIGSVLGVREWHCSYSIALCLIFAFFVVFAVGAIPLYLLFALDPGDLARFADIDAYYRNAEF